MEDYFYLDGKGLLYHIVPANKEERAQLVGPKDLLSKLIKWYDDHPTRGHFR